VSEERQCLSVLKLSAAVCEFHHLGRQEGREGGKGRNQRPSQDLPRFRIHSSDCPTPLRPPLLRSMYSSPPLLSLFPLSYLRLARLGDVDVSCPHGRLKGRAARARGIPTFAGLGRGRRGGREGGVGGREEGSGGETGP